MKSCYAAITVMAVLTVVGCTGAPKGHREAEKTALESAEKWLALVDSEQYAESWEGAAEYFKAFVTKDQWEQTIQAVRRPLGKKVSRQIKSREYAASVPGGPDGEYVVLQFNTGFENKKSAVETVTPMLDKDGTWRVSGYYIK